MIRQVPYVIRTDLSAGKLLRPLAICQRSPDPSAVATAAARARGASARVTGAAAANAFGLTTQVPASAVYLTDGPAKTIDLGRRRVRLAKVSGKRVALAGGAGMLIEALRYLGKDAAGMLTAADVHRVASALKPTDIRQLQKSAHVAPDWMRPVIGRVTALGTAPSSPEGEPEEATCQRKRKT